MKYIQTRIQDIFWNEAKSYCLSQDITIAEFFRKACYLYIKLVVRKQSLNSLKEEIQNGKSS